MQISIAADGVVTAADDKGTAIVVQPDAVFIENAGNAAQRLWIGFDTFTASAQTTPSPSVTPAATPSPTPAVTPAKTS
jgi:hypothetical protein